MPDTPERLSTVTPYLAVDGAQKAIEWYGDVFGATVEYEPVVMPTGQVGHAELRVGDTVLMIADEFPEMNVLGPTTLGGTSVQLVIYVDDVDTVFADAVAKGATAEREPADQFHGSRQGTLLDPFGHRWSVSTLLEDLSGDEMHDAMPPEMHE